MSSSDNTSHIIQSLIVNIVIASAKAVAAVFTKSGAMLAEAIHSFADCTNQILLLLGVREARKTPDDKHPLGYGRTVYFWSFLVALLLFTGGGVFSVYEGYHKITSPEPVHYVGIGIAILLFALCLEGWATISNLREMKKRRGSASLWQYLRDTKDSDLVVVFGENSAASLGLLIALIATICAWLTEDSTWDGVGCLGIGLVLIGVAIFLAIEVKSLLLGESADPRIEGTVRALANEFQDITQLLHIITVQQGPGQVVVLVKLSFQPTLNIGTVSDVINQFEDRIRAQLPEVRWCFVEPDRPRV